MISWILDSSALINITSHLNKLNNIQKCNDKVYIADNQIIINIIKAYYQ